MNIWLLLPIVAFSSMLCTYGLRKYAMAKNLIDVPNFRSSHSVPTPRGGGLAIVFSFVAAIPVIACAKLLAWDTTLAFLGAGIGVAVLGFLDDHGHIAARWRLLGHFGAAGWILYWLGGVPPIIVLGSHVSLGWIGLILGSLYLVWMLNLFNFMDGIDGIAGVEALSVCIGACILYMLSGTPGLVWTPILLAMAVVGFLYWNFPPAKIFMGDAGSGFLGIIIGTISLQAGWVSFQLLSGILILLGVFIVDATTTLLRRMVRGEKIYEAHRTHAYQHAAIKMGTHLSITLAVGLINLLWLLPISVCVVLFDLDGLLGILIAYIPLVIIAIKFHAGLQPILK
jgi:Fuc2NAc and GlcNAc transferase